MYINKISAMVATFSILLSLAVIIKPVASGATAVKVNPSLIEYHENAVGQQFNVTIEITDVTNLYGFDMILKWNTTFLAHVSHSIRVPRDTYADGVLWNPILPLKNEVNATGTYQIAFASMWPAPSFNGTGTVFTITFQIISQPVQPAPDANITLQLYSTELSNNIGGPIPHTTQDGTVMLYALAAAGHDVAVANLTSCYNSTILAQNRTYNVNVTVTNEGGAAETFTLTLYWNTTNLINSTIVTLNVGETKGVQLDWNSTGYARYKSYKLSAYATPVPGETDTADNTFVDPRNLLISYPGDIDGNKKVEVKDVAAIAKLFGVNYPDPKYDPNKDITCDGKIDVKDVAIAAKNFGYVE